MEKNKNRPKKTICIKFTKTQISNFKKKLKIEFYSYFNTLQEELNNNIKDETKTSLYFLRYTQYIKYEFNCQIVNMMIVYFNRIKSFPKRFKNESNFIYKLVNLLKHLFMNELEVACFTILLDKIQYDCMVIEQWYFLFFVGITSKKLCGTSQDLILIINYFSRKEEKFLDEYSSFLNNEKLLSSIFNKKILLKQINKRYIFLNKPKNTYCRKNYLNINGIVDKIVKMCQPYFMNKPRRTTNARQKKKNSKKQIDKKNNSELNGFTLIKPCQLIQFNNYNTIKNNSTIINLESINDLGNNIDNSLDIFEKKNIYDSDFSLSKLDSISSFKFEDI